MKTLTVGSKDQQSEDVGKADNYVVQSDIAKKTMKTSTVVNVNPAGSDAVVNDPTTDVSSTDVVPTPATFWKVFFSLEPAVATYNRSTPCTIRSWLEAFPFEFLFSVVHAMVCFSMGLGLYFIHREYFSSNMYDAMWCGVFWWFVFLIGSIIGVEGARYHSADLNKAGAITSSIGNISGAGWYVVLSWIVRIGPFSGSDASASWAHLAWLQFVSTLAGLWFACCGHHFSSAFRRMYKDRGVKLQHSFMYCASVSTTASIAQIASVIVTFVITYFSQGEQTLQNQAIEVLIVGVAYPCIRIGWRLWNTKTTRGLLGQVDAGFIERLTNYQQISSNLAFGMVGAVMASLLLSWTSYFISLVSNAVVEIGSELLTLRMHMRSHRKNSKICLQDLLDMQAFRLSVCNEADQVVALIAPLMSGCLMEIVLRSTNADAAFVGWHALLLRIPIGLFLEVATDLAKTMMAYKYFGVNVLGVQRQRSIWNLFMITFTPFTVPGCTLVGMCLAQ